MCSPPEEMSEPSLTLGLRQGYPLTLHQLFLLSCRTLQPLSYQRKQEHEEAPPSHVKKLPTFSRVSPQSSSISLHSTVLLLLNLAVLHLHLEFQVLKRPELQIQQLQR